MNTKVTPIWVHRFAVLTAFSTVLLLAAGALVTGTGSGLAVPDWPLSYGQFMPPMVGGVFFEHGHRLVAGTVALMMVALALLTWRYEPRRWVRGLAFAGLFAVLAQAGLGGLTVIFKLPKQVSIAHACLAQLFFSTTVILSLVTSKHWWTLKELSLKEKQSLLGLRSYSLAMAILFFVQLLLGATVRHFGAGLAIPDFPQVFGGLLPPAFTFPIAVHFAHRIGAYTLLLLVFGLIIQVMRNHSEKFVLTGFAGALAGLVSFQVMLGAAVIWMRRPVPVTTIHLVVGALCLATSILLTVYCYRLSYGAKEKSSFAPNLELEPA